MKLSPTSELRLRGVHPDLAKVVRKAAEITTIDFIVTCGKRTVEEQRHLVKIGASQTMNSRHLPRPDGYSRAVDLAPLKGGKPAWDWPLVYKVAAAMREAARLVGVPVEWGAVWDRTLNDLRPTLEAEAAAYVARRRAIKRRAFADGPHFQLPRNRYP